MLTTVKTAPIFRFCASVVCRPKIGKIRICVTAAQRGRQDDPEDQRLAAAALLGRAFRLVAHAAPSLFSFGTCSVRAAGLRAIR